MSLDVYLNADAPPTVPKVGSGIFVRRNGQTVEISREEWDRDNPWCDPVTATADVGADTCVYDSNITHNLNKMADAAGIYKQLWRPEEIGITHARQLIEPLTAGLDRLKSDPECFRTFNPPNGWGDYDGLVRFVSNYLAACKAFPESTVRVSR